IESSLVGSEMCIRDRREDIMSDDTVISTMVNGYRSHKFGKISNKERS
ncbi:hypothetical protein L8P11_22330, partial [Enterobacter kobei]|nr:hypothetical protein [Enterobacter kobei]